MPQIVYFPYLGPNRRSDLRLVEARVEFTTQQASEEGLEGFADYIRQLLAAGGVLTPGEVFPPDPFPDLYMRGFASLLAQTALLLQRKAGHDVDFYQVTCEPERRRCIVLVEHEHCDVGMTAMKLAVELVHGKRSQLAQPFREFRDFARERILPLETKAIIAAARRHGVPCAQLEQYPLEYKEDRFGRIRKNGALRLGHGARGRVLEGSILPREVSESVKAWLGSAEARRRLLQSLDIPPAAVPPAGAHRFHVVVVGGHVFAAEELGERRARAVANIDKSVSELALRVYREAGSQTIDLMLAGEGLDRPLGAGVDRGPGFSAGAGPGRTLCGSEWLPSGHARQGCRRPRQSPVSRAGSGAHPNRRDHRDQRQDHHQPHDRSYLQTCRAETWPDLHDGNFR